MEDPRVESDDGMSPVLTWATSMTSLTSSRTDEISAPKVGGSDDGVPFDVNGERSEAEPPSTLLADPGCDDIV